MSLITLNNSLKIECLKTSDSVEKRCNDRISIRGSVSPQISGGVLKGDELRLIRISDDGGDLGQRPERDDGVGRRVSFNEASVGQTKSSASRIGMTVGLFVNGELGHRRNVVVAPVE